jgi:hypothetical protein
MKPISNFNTKSAKNNKTASGIPEPYPFPVARTDAAVLAPPLIPHEKSTGSFQTPKATWRNLLRRPIPIGRHTPGSRFYIFLSRR